MSDSQTIQAVIWDLDGVIIDSAEEHRLAWKRLAEETGITFTDEDFWDGFGQRNDGIIPKYWGVHTPEEIQALGDRKESYFREYIRKSAAPLPGAIELMAGLKQAGFKQALASSTPLANIVLIDEVLGLQQYLTALVSGESVKHGKPAPDVFLKAASELHVEPTSSLVIEDAVAGIQAARSAGMHCIAVTAGKSKPGLLVADLVVSSLKEVSVERIQQLEYR